MSAKYDAVVPTVACISPELINVFLVNMYMNMDISIVWPRNNYKNNQLLTYKQTLFCIKIIN
jgi:hypothetical protein